MVIKGQEILINSMRVFLIIPALFNCVFVVFVKFIAKLADYLGFGKQGSF